MPSLNSPPRPGSAVHQWMHENLWVEASRDSDQLAEKLWADKPPAWVVRAASLIEARAIDGLVLPSRPGDPAAREVEAYCEIALTRQTISLTVLPDYGTVALPVGPLAPDANVTADGAALGNGVTADRWPVLMLPDWMHGPVRVTYEAGFGDTPGSVPDDLQLAIMEQAAFAYDNRGNVDVKPGLTPAAARIAARYRRVRA